MDPSRQNESSAKWGGKMELEPRSFPSRFFCPPPPPKNKRKKTFCSKNAFSSDLLGHILDHSKRRIHRKLFLPNVSFMFSVQGCCFVNRNLNAETIIVVPFMFKCTIVH